MSQLPYPLEFVHKFNLYKWLGFLVEDDDLPSIARIYGAPLDDLQHVERKYRGNVARLAAQLAAERPPARAGTPVTILALGDSLTSDRESYVKILRAYWEGDANRRIIDCGVSGDTGSDVLNRFHRTVLNQEFDWAVIFLGVNDCRQLDEPKGISNISLEEYQRDLRYIAWRLLERGKKLVHVTLPPADNRRLKEFFPDANWVYDPRRLEATNSFIRKLAAENGSGVADLAAAIAGTEQDVLEADGLHLNNAGQLMLCRLLLEVLP